MIRERTIFSQLLDLVPKRQFRRIVSRYNGNHGVKGFSCWDQFLCMSFAQLSGRESLRDIEVCLRSFEDKLYGLGFRGHISRSTLSYANKHRDSRIYRDLCASLMKEAKRLYEGQKIEFLPDEMVYLLDSTYISLCRATFPWARMGQHSNAIFKINTQLDLRGSIPSFILITTGKYGDNQFIDDIVIEPGAFYVMDRGYDDPAKIYTIHKARGYFITRLKRCFKTNRLKSNKVDKSTGIRADQSIRFAGKGTYKKYPDQLRKVVYVTPDTKQRLAFITNNFILDPIVVAQLYKARWEIELFFKWIKQHLRIKKFYGTTQNAVETQVWIAVINYLLIAIAKKRFGISLPLYRILHFLSVSLFEKTPINQAFSKPIYTSDTHSPDNQLILL